ncbi:hypothetical protein L6164_010756 [Bauhinia variegata]|uniref:Uncharacterized protein n=1 Tax=Bauhinia variegata TaxID=167791 RepID=A0ACB9P6B4_BAUVA|nr:hypothetical protein L6164_010756 [Bauhinia variegata]
MEQTRKPELINLAIQKLIEDERSKKITSGKFLDNNDDDAEYQLLLSRLLSELEMLKGDELLKQSEASCPQEVVTSAIHEIKSDIMDVDGCRERESGTDEIVKELKKVKRQNFVTHCLLSAMIVLTLAWQLSEVSLIMKVKNGFSHPFRTFGSMLSGILKGPDPNGHQEDKKEHQLEPPILPFLPSNTEQS